ncbi:MAG: hypothetical protein EB107_15340, partial [Proteobacteria bacterium]|nr:hypothetical protein [Pseudomonadota bacterium]
DVPVPFSIALDYVLPVGATDARLRCSGAITILTDEGTGISADRSRSEANMEGGRGGALRTREPVEAGEPDPGWCVWQGNAQVRAMVRADRSRPPGPGTARWSLEVKYGRPN